MTQTAFPLLTLLVTLVLAVTLSTNGAHAADNGLARTPPMGWMSWMKYACNIDCKSYPKECINDQLYRDMIDRLAEDGYLALGYNTVNIDDCWSEMARDPTTKRLVPHHERFPAGIKSLVDYAHAKKMQFGIYQDVGTKTCGGYPGTRDGNVDHTAIDAQTFSDWGVDSLKLDGCYEATNIYNQTYPEYYAALQKLPHHIAYACSWPAYLINKLTDHDYALIQKNCNYWRNYNDIVDSWHSVQVIIEFYAKNAATFARFHGPGGWFDPDMLIIGNPGLSVEQAKTQMALWSVWSAPLLMSNDLRTIGPEFKAILQNRHLIEVDQDPLGLMGQCVKHLAHQQVWTKKLSPKTAGAANPWVVLYLNQNTLGVPSNMSYKLGELIPDLKHGVKYEVHDLYEGGSRIATLTAEDHLTLRVQTSGSVRVVKLVPLV